MSTPSLKRARRTPQESSSSSYRRILGGITPARFLRDHWQKRPLVVRGAFPDFSDPLTPDELAGLSCEDGIESRIVIGELDEQKAKRRHRWTVEWGPHAESRFSSLPERGWTLLVQELNRTVPEAALLLDELSFLPNVRVDDVMVSYAAPGGSVGPHVDSYDVFLIQGRGERRWRFDTRLTKDVRFVPGIDLKILESFVLDADEVFRAGDLLYLPPGFAHWGIAETECLTYSIGFRSPNAGEAWTGFAAHSAKGCASEVLLVDPPLEPASNPGAIPRALRERVRQLVRSMDMSDDAIDRWFASFATQLKPGHELEPPSRAPKADAIMARLRRGGVIARSEEGRYAFLERPRGRLLFYIAGEEIELDDASAVALAKELCARRRFSGAAFVALLKTRAARELLTRLFARGALAFA